MALILLQQLIINGAGFTFLEKSEPGPISWQIGRIRTKPFILTFIDQRNENERGRGTACFNWLF